MAQVKWCGFALVFLNFALSEKEVHCGMPTSMEQTQLCKLHKLQGQLKGKITFSRHA